MRVGFLASWGPHKNKSKNFQNFSDITPTANKNVGLRLDEVSSQGNYSLKNRKTLVNKNRGVKMQKIKLFSIAFLAVAFISFTATAENLAKNGSFEEDADLQNPDSFTQKGFVVTKQWTKNWIINIGTKPCEFAIVEEPGAPDGKKFLRVKSSGASHIYTLESIPGNTATKVTFSAKGDALDGKGPTVKVHAYLYKTSDGSWYGKNYTAGSFTLEKGWKTFTVDIPVQAADANLKVAFEFEGVCDIDNVKIEK
jgi:hypothetical protein